MQDSDRQRQAVLRHFENVSTEWGTHYSGEMREISHLDLLGRRAAAHAFLERVKTEHTETLTVLDVGCGSGDVLPALDPKQWKVFGVDLVEAMVRAADRQLSTGHFSVADAVNMPFRSDSVDVVTCLGVLEYIPDWSGALRAIRSVLKPGGHLVVSFPNRQSLFRRMGHLETRLIKGIKAILSRNGEDKSRSGYQRHEWTTRESEQSLVDHGFTVHDSHFVTYGVKGRFGDHSKVNLAIASKFKGKLTRNSLISRGLAWTTIYSCVKTGSSNGSAQSA